MRSIVFLGFEPGTPDGLPGSNTKAALKKFQAQQQLPITAVFDAATMDALRKQQALLPRSDASPAAADLKAAPAASAPMRESALAVVPAPAEPALTAAVAEPARDTVITAPAWTLAPRGASRISMAMQGFFRPLVGTYCAIFGFALMKSGVIPLQSATPETELYLHMSVCFLLGFSERLARDLFIRAGEGLASAGGGRAA